MDEFWTALANFGTVTGVSLFGVIVAARWIARKTARTFVRHRDKKALGSEFEVLHSLALRDPSFSDDSAVSIRRFVADRQKELDIVIRQSVATELKHILEEPAPGSTHLRNRDLFRVPNLLMPIRIETLNGTERLSIEDVATRFHQGGKRGKFLVIGDAGSGKSVAVMDLARRLTEKAKETPWPFILRASDFERGVDTAMGSGDIGSERWCTAVLARRCLLDDPTGLQRHALARDLETQAVIIIDSLDEIVQRLERYEVERFFSSWLFTHSDVVVCRRGFYFSKLLGNAAIDDFHLLQMEAPTEEAMSAFVTAAAKETPGADLPVVTERVHRVQDLSPDIKVLAKTPLLLMMLVEVLSEESTLGANIDTATIYEAFVHHSLRREQGRAGAHGDWNLALPVLHEVAWQVIAAGSSGTRARTVIDQATIATAINAVAETPSGSERDSLAKLILSLPVFRLVRTATDRFGTAVEFHHESFAEFLVARRVYQWLIGTANTGADFFDHIDTPEVSYFLKEYLARIRSDPSVNSHVQARMRELLDRCLALIAAATTETQARTLAFAAGQVAYYLGMVVDASGAASLEAVASSDADFWVRRAVAIGLAFGGYPAALNKFIDEMWSGIDTGDFAAARKNIGIELGFYGDQFFDILDPTIDRGGSSCRKTVTRIAHQCRLDVESPNTRMDMFDILYLAHYREASRDDFEVALVEVRHYLDEWLSRAEQSPSRGETREVRLLRELLSKRLGAEARVGDIP